MDLKIHIILPAHNEGIHCQNPRIAFSSKLAPTKIVVVNDHSEDKTQDIIERFKNVISFIDSVVLKSESDHQPGSKIIRAFYKGLNNWIQRLMLQVRCRLNISENYLETIASIFQNNPKCGIAGGFTIQKNGVWEIENLTNKDHVEVL